MFKQYFTRKHIQNKKALFNLILSDRSDGKTFDFKVQALEDYRTKKAITPYIRRFKTELTNTLYDNFFGDVVGDNKPEKQEYRNLYGSWKFKGCKRGVEVSTDNGKTWDWIVFFIPLTMSGKLKSQLDNYVQRIFTMGYDEYVPLDNRYANNEMTLLMELWKSVDRDRDIVQLFITGNKLTPFNPFMDYFNISMQITQDKIKLYRDGTLAVQIYSSKEHRQVRSKSRFNSLVKGTEYDDYNMGGVLQALNLKVASHIGCKYFSSFMTDNGEGSIWSNGRQFVVSQVKRRDGFVLVDKIRNTGREEYTITFGKFTPLFRRLYRTGQLYFEDEKSYHMFENILVKAY
ncbi:phage DNA encapsidation protein [Clostridium sp.]|uniref:phage DNA encapsidation protein n=1 Tax=Clostridium sp. TaxID=1506 RepID=UPI0025BB627E|nr:phage DNA encapsidation protein [Clostridium sp.]